MRAMLRRRFLVVVLTVASMATAGCSSLSSWTSAGSPLPDGPSLVRGAAEATSGINSTHFTMGVTGALPTNVTGLTVLGAQGDLIKDGRAQGVATVEELGQRLQIAFVVVDHVLYVKGPTGGFQQVPGGTALYDPGAILDPNRGAARLLSSVSGAKTERREDVGGVATYRVTGHASKDVVTALAPGVQSDVDVTFWLRQDGAHQPVRVVVQIPPSQPGAAPATVDMALSDVDKPVTITPPA